MNYIHQQNIRKDKRIYAAFILLTHDGVPNYLKYKAMHSVK